MDYRYKQLEQDLSALAKLFSDLGLRLSEAGKEVTASGVIPAEKLLDQIVAARANFENVRAAVHGHAGSMLVSPLPKLVEILSVPAIDALLKASATAEEGKFSVEGERERAVSILSRVLAITHRETSDFKPLQECQAKVGELRNAISKVAWPHRHAEVESITASKHPSTALLSFVENLDTLEDDRWMALEATITEAYGKPLFVAASRGKLVAQPAAGKTPAAVVPAAKPVVEKKTAAEKPAAPTAPAVTVEKKIPAPLPVATVTAEKKEPAPEKAKTSPTPVSALPTTTSLAAPTTTPAAIQTPAPIAPAVVTQTAPPAPVATPSAPVPAAVPVVATPVTTALPQRPAAVSVAAAPPAPAATAPTVSAPPANTTNSLNALATATEPAAERKPVGAPTENGDKQRKEPRLAAPAAQPAAKSETKAQEQEPALEDSQRALAGDPSQRPQRWGFWRGNR